MQLPEMQAAADACAAAARLRSLLPQYGRFQQANAPEGAEAAYYLVQTAVARLYEALSDLPDNHPVSHEAHKALDAVTLVFCPDAVVPVPAFSHRLEIIAAGAAISDLLASIKERNKPADADLRHALAEAAAKELVHADYRSRNLPPLPETGWSKRQQRALESEVRASLTQAIENTHQASIAYRAAMPYIVMPRLAAARIQTAGRNNLLDALNRHTDDHLHAIITLPYDNADGEAAAISAMGLVYRQTRYLKTIDEQYPDGYPRHKIIPALETAIRQLQTEGDKYRDEDNRRFCAQAAARGQALLDDIKGDEHAAIAGRVAEITGDTITMVSVTQVKAAPAVLDQAYQLLEQEAVMNIAFDDQGDLIARSLSAKSP